MLKNNRRNGRVILVGAGPGDPGLITVRGRDWIARADTLVYDNLVADELIALAPERAKRVYVGKVAGKHTMPQESINALLVEEAQAGALVIRLKGGDPFIFGRGGEECLYLAEAGVPFEIVPGVSAVAAAPAYAGIPLTHRDIAAEFHVITGHEHAFKERAGIDWSAIAGLTGTLVIFMGLYRIDEIAINLIHHGRKAHTPCAIIHRGTEPNQRSIIGPLSDIARRTREADLRPPALIVIGEAVRLRDRLNWFEDKPLAGWRIAIPSTQSSVAQQLRERGARVVELGLETACAAIEQQREYDSTQEKIPLEVCDAALFTGPEQVAPLIRALLRQGQDIRALGGLRLIAIGAATRVALNAYGLAPDIEIELLRDLNRRRQIIDDCPGLRMLLPCVGDPPSSSMEYLSSIGVKAVPIRLDEASRRPSPALGTLDENYDLMAIPCEEDARNLRERFGERALVEFAHRTPIAAISPGAFESLGLDEIHPVIVPLEPSMDALTDAIQEFAKSHGQNQTSTAKPTANVDVVRDSM